ncbi:LysR family transcriptional regulator [Secundilactobacillus folii]|uniref:LysR family transcriptional regulator n=1 Tax=Secundilactobacillus folii TaxID=2678357 RepID=A0A7X2XTW2_9LACO|nr:LysR family transcriptional regulator [Secundilactobacillus folii]MTV81483.1 LysR family transcriptional regulator [Secundilactobacillus folii]
MKIANLKYFVEVATEMSFTRASEKLFISQPTLSRHIQELESELGVKLFDRQSHTLKLTENGRQFLNATTDVLAQVDNLAHMFDDQDEESRSRGIFNIGYLSNFNFGFMFELLNQFKVSHPNVQFIMNQDIPMNLADGLSSGNYDLVFCQASYFLNRVDIKRKLFMENHLQIAIPLQNPLSQRTKVSFADLKDETFILLERQKSPVIVDYVINLGLKNGFNLRADYYVNTLDEGLSMVAVGKGIAFLYSGMNNGTLEDRYHIKIADLKEESLDQNIVAAIRKDNQNQLLQNLYAAIKVAGH